MRNPIISVVVCTYNRANLLAGCLQSLVEQTLDGGLFEVIIINNNSMDNTLEISERFVSSHSNFRIITESCQGLSHARNRGGREAAGEYIAYIDDDAIAFSDWILQINAFVKRHPEIKVFGGPYQAYSLTQIPDWFPPEYGSWSLGDKERPIFLGKEWINGTNMVFHKEVLLRFCGFDSQLGMAGDKISYGEETKLLVILKNENIPVYYVPQMKVRHLVADYKMKLSWLFLASYKVGKCSGLTFGVRRSLYSHVFAIGACILVGVFTMMKGGVTPFKRSMYVAFSPLATEVGAFVEYFSRRVS